MTVKSHFLSKRKALAGLLLAVFAQLGASQVYAAGEVKAVATFSILGDLVRQVGGDRVNLTVLVGAGGDSHVFQSNPAQARSVGQAQVLFSNGLGYESWVRRLVQAAKFKGRHVVVSQGIETLKATDSGGHGHGHAHDEVDPHAWQSVGNVKRYVKNIADGLCAVDAAGCMEYRRNEQSYQAELDRLEAEIRVAWESVPIEQRKVITSHDAFGYYARAYQVRFLAAQGTSTSAEATTKGVARLVRQIKAEGVKALFVESISDPRLIEQVGRETGIKPSGTLFSDSLSQSDDSASSYAALMRHNTRVLVTAVQGKGR
ncbi:metal ABC transporter solute-binding protein, Zn/Mn family [Ottowia sp. VDI28]|uniref:metal ABC transporter solute-binding protein, Zn/Mn family n=1 Tax=Ottowia sp. VDI28 TaxID=3133968 RepID=UPI003C30A17B